MSGEARESDGDTRLRIRDKRGNERLFALDGFARATFGRKSERMQAEHPRVVKFITRSGCGTVLCGAGQVLSGALCVRFRIPLETNAVRYGLFAEFMFGDADAWLSWLHLLYLRQRDEWEALPSLLPCGHRYSLPEIHSAANTSLVLKYVHRMGHQHKRHATHRYVSYVPVHPTLSILEYP